MTTSNFINDLESKGLTKTQIAEKVGVSLSTLSRWVTGETTPRPAMEMKIRDIWSNLSKEDFEVAQVKTEFSPESVLANFSRFLGDLRELLHAKGRMSSRNEALEEISKLFFAHIVSISEGGVGVGGLADCPHGTLVDNLTEFVGKIYSSRVGKSKSHVGLNADDFKLCLKKNDELLATEIVGLFAKYFPAQFGIESKRITRLDLLNELFGRFLADSFLDEKQLGQYLTPPEVVKFVVDIALLSLDADERESLLNPSSPEKFGKIMDPSCGVGSFLSEFVHTASDEIIREYGERGFEKWLSRMEELSLVAGDKSERMIKLAFSNLSMSGNAITGLFCGNSLDRGNGSLFDRYKGTVGLIMTNPPFGAEFQSDEMGAYRVSKFGEGKLSSEVLFTEQYVDLLRPGGHLIAVLPDSILTNKGIFEKLRTMLSDKIELVHVISLPVETFGSAGTNTKTSIVHFRKKKAKRDTTTYFAICSSIGYNVVTKDNHRTKVPKGVNELELVLDDVRKGVCSFGKHIDGILKSERWDATYHASISGVLQDQINLFLKNGIKLSEVAEISKERIDPRRFAEKNFRYIEISDVDGETSGVSFKMVPCTEAPSRARKLVREGDVLVSTVRPERKAIGVVSGELDGAICTTGFAVVRPKSINSRVLAELLKTEVVNAQILRHNIGIAYPAIEEQILSEIYLPIDRAQFSMLEGVARRIHDAETELSSLRKSFKEQLKSLMANVETT